MLIVGDMFIYHFIKQNIHNIQQWQITMIIYSVI